MFGWLVKQRATTAIVVLVLTIVGAYSYVTLPREAQPDIDIPVVVVSTPYIGVSPADIEQLVTRPLEGELAGLKNLKEMRSTSAEGVSIITLEFEPDVDIPDALQRVRDRVSRAEPDLPDDAEDTEINEISFSDVPIVIVTIAGPIDEVELKELGERLQDKVERIPGVLEAKLSGGREREFRVQVDPHRLAHFALTLDDVASAMGTENVNVPGGEVRASDASILVRIPGDLKTARDIETVAVGNVGGRPVYVTDVARVVDDFEDRNTYARMNGEPAVSLAVTKRSGANILEVVDAVKAAAAEQAAKWPAGVSWKALGDQSRFTRDMVKELESNMLVALVLVVGVLVFFMGVMNSLFVALAIPLSMLLGMIVIAALGMTLNMIVLFSLILVLGMLVDNGIVLVENIYRHFEEGKSLYRASVDGAGEVAIAVTTSTLTTLAAFFPMIYWTGIMGKFMGFLPKTVIIMLTASLLTAVFILPVVTGLLMRRGRARKTAVAGPSVVVRVYQGFLRLSIRLRYLSLAGGLGFLAFTLWAYGHLNHGTEFFPETEPDRAVITVRAPDGMDLETTDRMVREIEGLLAAEPNVDVYVAETGVSGNGMDIGPSSSATNQARITIDFLPHVTKAAEGEMLRVEDTRLTVDRLREAVLAIPGAEFVVEKENMGPPVGAPIAVEVSGDHFHEVGELAAKVRRRVAEIEGATDLSDDYRVGRPELRLRVDRSAAKKIGASTQRIAGTIRTAIAGAEASKIRDGEDEYDIRVELAPRFKSDIQSVLALRVPGDYQGDTTSVPLSAVASYQLAGGSGSIRHVDQNLVVTIEGKIAEGYNANEVRENVGKLLKEIETPAGYGLRLGGADDEQRKTEEFLFRALVAAVLLIALVLVAQFNRLDLPFIILLSVVLSLIGVLWGLVITGTAFGVVMTGIGVISLAGVVVNNAIVLLDYVEQLRARGVSALEALVDAGTTRLRPVLLTAGTTVLGLIPMAIGVSLDIERWRLVWGGTSAAFWGPMAIAVIFGLAVATVLTLVMVPTLYAIFEDLWRVLGLSTKYGAEWEGATSSDATSSDGTASAAPAAE